MKNGIYGFLTGLFLLVAVPAGDAAGPGKINKIELAPHGDKAVLVLSHDGQGKFRVFQSEKRGNVVIEAENLFLPPNLTRAISGGSSGGPVLQVTPYSAGDSRKAMAKIVVQLRGRAEVISSEVPGKFVVEIARKSLPVAMKAPASASRQADELKLRDSANEKSEEIAKRLVEVLNAPIDEKRYFGSPVTFEGNNVSVHDVFRLVGEASGLNIVTDGNVKYESNYSLRDIPWDQLLDLVVQQAQLKASVIGNVVRIITMEKYNKEQEEKLKEIGIADEMEPVVMAVIPLSFATAEEMKKMIETLLIKRDRTSSSAAVGSAPATVASDSSAATASAAQAKFIQDFVRGQIQVDTRSNSLIVTNTKDTIERIRTLVRELDVPLPQVLIDAKIVIATEAFSRSIGVAWGGRATSSGTGRAGVGGGFNSSGIQLGDQGNAEAFTVSPGSAGAIGFQVGAGRHGNLNAQLSLAEVNGIGKTVASPRVIVNNKRQAQITDGQTLLVQTTPGANTTGEIQLVKAALDLMVTPQVTSVGSVLLQLDIKKDQPLLNGNIENKQMKTEVLVDSGSTLVLGGVYQFTQTKDENGIPLLKDLPFVGQFFRTNSDSTTKSELMVFITPQILEATKLQQEEPAAM